MDKYLIVDMYEGEYSNYQIAFMAIPLSQGYVGLLASRLASCQPAFEAGAYQVKFFDASAGVVDYWNDKIDPLSRKWYAVERLGIGLEDCVEGMVVHLNEESQELLGSYHLQVLVLDSDGDVWFRVAGKNDRPWVDSAKVPLARLCQLAGIEVPEVLVV